MSIHLEIIDRICAPPKIKRELANIPKVKLIRKIRTLETQITEMAIANNGEVVRSPDDWAKIIKQESANIMDVNVYDLSTQDRQKEKVAARYIAMHLILEKTDLSLKKVGSYFGNRDHSSVLHGRERVNQWLNDGLRCDKINRNNYLAVKNIVDIY